MTILLTIAGTLCTLGGIFLLKLSYNAWQHLRASTEILCEVSGILEAFYRQQEEVKQMMGEDEEEARTIGLKG